MTPVKGFVRIASVALVLGGAAAWQSMPADAQPHRSSTSHCPHAALALPGNGVARAADEALAAAPHLYRGTDTSGRSVILAARSTSAGPYGAQVRHECGTGTADRTVVVQLLFPKLLPSQSLSQGTVFLSRFPRGYRVWEIAH